MEILPEESPAEELAGRMRPIVDDIRELLDRSEPDTQAILLALIEVLGCGMADQAWPDASQEEFEQVVAYHADLVRQVALLRFADVKERLH